MPAFDALTRPRLIRLLDRFGRSNRPFYRWFDEHDLLTGCWQAVTLSILGTEVWQLVAEVSDYTPDEIGYEAVRLILATYSSFSYSTLEGYNADIKAPCEGSAWGEFFLGKADYQSSTILVEMFLDVSSCCLKATA